MKRTFLYATIVGLVLTAGSLGCGPSATESGPVLSASPVPRVGFTIDFIDVGQGDAILITAATGEILLIDGGRDENRLRDRLETMGVVDLDAIALTHPHADHAAGLIEALERFPVERVYLNGGDHDTRTFARFMDAVEAEGAAVTTVTRGDVIPLGNLILKVLHPAELSGDLNADSMVLLLDCGDVEVLLTGDAETPSEEEMAVAGVLLDIDVLKVGHHGSRTSSSQPFLDALLPEVAVISAGRDSPYGHPHEEAASRLASSGARTLVTDTTAGPDGIRMTSDCETYSIGPMP